MSKKLVPRTLAQALLGRSFVHPLVDYLVIGGGLSLALTGVVLWLPRYGQLLDNAALPYFILLSNSAHFAASTVRLYTKPGSYESLPFLTMGFPLAALAVLTLCLLLPGDLGPHLNALYITWSPFHYAAQAYGLAVMYSYRSGCQLGLGDKRLLWWASMLPFFYMFVASKGSGMDWLLPESVLAWPAVEMVREQLTQALPYVAFAAVPLVALKVWRGPGGPPPVISLLMLVTNGVWWFVLATTDAFVWASIFHGIQYLAIVTVFHVKDQVARPGNRHGRLYHALWLYGACLLLGYGLFSCLPWAYVFAGFHMSQSVVLVTAAINIHHFIVDAYIWRLKQGDTNRRIVEAGIPATA
jgi:hypothetical protein